MSKPIKVAMILAVAAVAIAATQMASSKVVAPASVAPMEMMINVGPLPETKVSSHF